LISGCDYVTLLKIHTLYIKRLEIKQFKAFESVSFDFHPRINVFTGVNNAGKTTALEAIALWHECFRALIRPAGKSVKGKYIKGDYILGTSNPTYISYHDITSVRSPGYKDIFHKLII
jgi:AAA15 family ATPase/GTPase